MGTKMGTGRKKGRGNEVDPGYFAANNAEEPSTPDSDADYPADDARPVGPTPAAPQAAAGRAPSDREEDTVDPNKLARKNWMVPQSLSDQLRRARVAYKGADADRAYRLDGLSEQSFIAALLSYACDRLEDDLKQGPSIGLAGDLEARIPKKARLG